MHRRSYEKYGDEPTRRRAKYLEDAETTIGFHLLSTYYAPDSLLSALQVIAAFKLPTILGYYHLILQMETEVQKSTVTCSWSHSYKCWSLDLNQAA